MDLRRMKQCVFSILFSFLLVFVLLVVLQRLAKPVNAASTNLFVKPGEIGSCSQSSPCDLQTALSTASDFYTIYLFKGTYTGSGDAVITVTNSLTIFGGWNGSLVGPIERDPTLYPTVINGEGIRRGIFIKSIALPITVTIDGITVTGGFAGKVADTPGRGGGIYGFNLTPIITNNTITNNIAGPAITDGFGKGGGIYLNAIAGTAIISNNVVISNVANLDGLSYGGGIFFQAEQGHRY